MGEGAWGRSAAKRPKIERIIRALAHIGAVRRIAIYSQKSAVRTDGKRGDELLVWFELHHRNGRDLGNGRASIEQCYEDHQRAKLYPTVHFYWF